MNFKIQQTLINNFIAQYTEGDQLGQTAAFALVCARSRFHGFDSDLHTEMAERYQAAEDLFLLCQAKGNIELMETARDLLEVYYALTQAMNGFGSADETLLWNHIERLVA